MLMLWLKAVHVIAWLPGLRDCFTCRGSMSIMRAPRDALELARFEIMERRLFILMTIGAALTMVFGLAMLIAAPGYLSMTWLRVKLLLVLLLVAYHGYCFKLLRDFAQRRNSRSANWYRVFNELPTLLLIGIVILAVVKPF